MVLVNGQLIRGSAKRLRLDFDLGKSDQEHAGVCNAGT